jgi:hypothetical protein
MLSAPNFFDAGFWDRGEFPHEIVRPTGSLAERTFTDIRRWSVMLRGRLLAAIEQPEVLAH